MSAVRRRVYVSTRLRVLIVDDDDNLDWLATLAVAAVEGTDFVDRKQCCHASAVAGGNDFFYEPKRVLYLVKCVAHGIDRPETRYHPSMLTTTDLDPLLQLVERIAVALERQADAAERFAEAHEAANAMMKPMGGALTSLALSQMPAVDDGRDDFCSDDEIDPDERPR